MASKTVIPFLVGMMLLTGVANTLLTKLQVRCLILSRLSLSCQTSPLGRGEQGGWPVLRSYRPDVVADLLLLCAR